MTGQLWTVRDCAEFLRVHRATVPRLVEKESLPCRVLTAGKRRHLRFVPDEVCAWIDGRRERQLRGLVDGTRYARGRR